MKYTLLTKEQFENLHQEFSQFLATQSIDVKEWNSIKKEKPQMAEEEMKIFSDIVWEDVLTKSNFLEHYSKDTLNLFKCDEKTIKRIAIKVNWDINLQTQKGVEWLLQNPMDNSVDIFKGEKKYTKERNLELFDLIQKGSVISDGKIYQFFKDLIN